MFTMQVRMLVAKHDKFTPGCCYWFAAAVKYSNGEEIWTSQLGIELEMLPLASILWYYLKCCEMKLPVKLCNDCQQFFSKKIPLVILVFTFLKKTFVK